MKLHSTLPSKVLLSMCLAHQAFGFHATSIIPTSDVYRSNDNLATFSRGAQRCYKYHTTIHSQRTTTTLSESNTGNSDPSSLDPSTKQEIRNIAQHLATQTLETLLSKSDALTISNELFFNDNSNDPIFNENTREQYNKYYSKLTTRLREENRTPADLLGDKITKKILDTMRGDGKGSYDVETVRTFLESDAINSLFAKLLYDAIFEFTTKFDILGNAISNLPLLGPMRAQILKESKRNMDRTLGPLLQRFLSGYTRVAIRQAVDFVVSEENASSFGKANARLVGYLLEKRTVSEWIPQDKTLDKWREDIWDYLVGLEENGKDGGLAKEDQKKIVRQSVDWTYELAGDKCVEDLGVDVNMVLDASPTFERKLGEFWQRCQNASSNNARE